MLSSKKKFLWEHKHKVAATIRSCDMAACISLSGRESNPGITYFDLLV